MQQAKEEGGSQPEVLRVISKLFSQTPKLLALIDHQFCHGPRNPLSWPDLLLPYQVDVGEVSAISDTMPAVNVSVRGLEAYDTPESKLSALGRLTIHQLWNSFDGEDNEEFFGDQRIQWHLALDTLKASNSRRFTEADEAVIARLYMLNIIATDPNILAWSSDCAQNIALNTEIDSIKTVWTPAVEQSEGVQIGTQEGTSHLYVRTLSEYVAIMSCKHDCASIKDVDGEIVYPITYVPVHLGWQGKSWLIPYILSFTTTEWWNHSVLIESTLSGRYPRSEASSDIKLKAKFMPRAATVLIPGNYKHICLVVVDCLAFVFDGDYEICSGISAKRQGEHNFAAMVHAYLGRTASEGVPKMSEGEVSYALHKLVSCFANAVELQKTLLKCAVLATSKYNGYGIIPGPNTSYQNGGTIEADRISAPYCFNSKFKMGEHELVDLISLSAEALTEMLDNHKHWRTDPLGYFAFGSVGISTDDSHRPIPEKNKVGTVQYALRTLDPSIRIMMACGVYDMGPQPNLTARYIIQTALTYGSLVLGLTNWAAAELGETIFMHNRMGRLDCLDFECQLAFQWSTITGGFVIPCQGVNRVVDQSNHHQILGVSMNIASKAADIPVSWYETHYSWNCPWWYVAFIAKCLGHSFPHKSELKINNLGNTLGWLVKPENRFDLCILSDNTYELNRDTVDIMTYSKNGGRGYHNISCYHYALTDSKKNRFGVGREVLMCELNVIILVKENWTDCTTPTALVSLNENSREFKLNSKYYGGEIDSSHEFYFRKIIEQLM